MLSNILLLIVLGLFTAYGVRKAFKVAKRIRMAGYDQLTDDPELEKEALATPENSQPCQYCNIDGLAYAPGCDECGPVGR